MKKLLTKMPFFPEAILALMSSFWIIDLVMGHTVNYFMVAFSMLIIAILLLKNKIVSTTFSCITGILSLFILGASISEFAEFPVINTEAMLLLTVGSALATIVALMSALIFYKYQVLK